MKSFNLIAIVLGLTFAALLQFTTGRVHHHSLQIEENGISFSEEIEIDYKRNVEIFRVPAHNNVKGADFYHDFKTRLTVIKVPSENACYVTKMHSSLPSPPKLNADIKRAALQPGSVPVTTKPNLLTVAGSAYRPGLTKEALEFCGALPIYNTEISPLNSTSNSGVETIHTRLHKRQVPRNTVVNFTLCNKANSLEHVQSCIEAEWNLRCRIKTGTCYYYVSCKNMVSEGTKDWECEQSHITFKYPACCEFVCPLPTPTPRSKK